MVLGVSYNVFDGEELLEGSIRCIRGDVFFISVVYQRISNSGNKCNDNLVDKLNHLYRLGLIDELYLYNPDLSLESGENELRKRNIGLELSINNGCTHHMSMDTDEYFIKDEFKYLKSVVDKNNYDSSFSKMLTYYKTSEYVIDPPEEYYVPLIYKIREGVKFVMNLNIPVLVDPTRRMNIGSHVVFDRSEIQMHHLSMVRDNIASKFNNSSAKSLYSEHINKMCSEYANWSFPNKVLYPGNPPFYTNVKKVNQVF